MLFWIRICFTICGPRLSATQQFWQLGLKKQPLARVQRASSTLGCRASPWQRSMQKQLIAITEQSTSDFHQTCKHKHSIHLPNQIHGLAATKLFSENIPWHNWAIVLPCHSWSKYFQHGTLEALDFMSNGAGNHVAQNHSQRVIRKLWKQKQKSHLSQRLYNSNSHRFRGSPRRS